MQNVLNTILQYVQQGIAGIFRFIGLVWGWVIGQVNSMVSLPWATLPWWKLLIAAVACAGAGYLLYSAGRSIWGAVEATLKAFANLLSQLVTVLPKAILAGLVLFGALWFIRTF